MNVERMKHLKKILEDIEGDDRVEFDMGQWAFLEGRFYHEDITLPELKEMECGFAACALGFAATDPEFVKSGLKLKHIAYKTKPNGSAPGSTIVDCEDEQGFYAAVRFFDINLTEAYYLFDLEEYTNEPVEIWEVVDRIDYLLSHGGSSIELGLDPEDYEDCQGPL